MSSYPTSRPDPAQGSASSVGSQPGISRSGTGTPPAKPVKIVQPSGGASAPVAAPLNPLLADLPSLEDQQPSFVHEREHDRPTMLSREGMERGLESDEVDGEEEDLFANFSETLRTAPSWLVSLVVHTALLILLALFSFKFSGKQGVTLEVIPSDKLGEQLLDDSLTQLSNDTMEIDAPMYSPNETEPVSDPFAAPPELAFESGEMATIAIAAPSIGMALSGRETGMKRALLSVYGGNRLTEGAVRDALDWLIRQQENDGSWSIRGPYSDGASGENKVAATAMALLAFQGYGSTHEVGPDKQIVAKGWRYLFAQLDEDGAFWQKEQADHGNLYDQAMATIALCELYGMSNDSQYKEPAQRAINYAISVQDRAGGWKYNRGGSDLSVTGWFVMALQTGRMAGLDVPTPALEEISGFLDSVARHDGSRYAYQRGDSPRLTMSSEGLLCRQYLGWTHEDERLQKGVEHLGNNPMDWREKNFYYWYYATQVMHHMMDHNWDTWNDVMKDVLVENQQKTGSERGSWSPIGDRWGDRGGRLYSTCLCVYMLESYYRHLPIYSEAF